MSEDLKDVQVNWKATVSEDLKDVQVNWKATMSEDLKDVQVNWKAAENSFEDRAMWRSSVADV